MPDEERVVDALGHLQEVMSELLHEARILAIDVASIRTAIDSIDNAVFSLDLKVDG